MPSKSTDFGSSQYFRELFVDLAKASIQDVLKQGGNSRIVVDAANETGAQIYIVSDGEKSQTPFNTVSMSGLSREELIGAVESEAGMSPPAGPFEEGEIVLPNGSSSFVIKNPDGSLSIELREE